MNQGQEVGANLRVDLVSKPKGGLGGMECLPCPDSSSSQQLEQGQLNPVSCCGRCCRRCRLRGWQELSPLHGDMSRVGQVSLHRGTVLCVTAAVVLFLGGVYSHFCLLAAKCWSVSGPGASGMEEFVVQHLPAQRTTSCCQLSEGCPEFCLLGSS